MCIIILLKHHRLHRPKSTRFQRRLCRQRSQHSVALGIDIHWPRPPGLFSLVFGFFFGGSNCHTVLGLERGDVYALQGSGKGGGLEVLGGDGQVVHARSHGGGSGDEFAV